jgi:hypothetical protein
LCSSFNWMLQRIRVMSYCTRSFNRQYWSKRMREQSNLFALMVSVCKKST